MTIAKQSYSNLNLLFLTLIFFLTFSSETFGRKHEKQSKNHKHTKNETQEVDTEKRADFIIGIANKISYPVESGGGIYRIGVFGKGKHIRELVHELENRVQNMSIEGKKVEVVLYKHAKRIHNVDLLYIQGHSKIRIDEINKRLGNHPYVILTENYPFGTSSLNFTLNKENELYYELKESEIVKKGGIIHSSLIEAPNRVDSEVEWEGKLKDALQLIEHQENKIERQVNKIQAQGTKIEAQSQEIDKKSGIIFYQRLIIVLAIAFLVMISFLGFMLLRVNRNRKRALKRITSSIEYAKLIQQAVLPPKTLISAIFPESFVFYQPKDIVSGDFYWLERAGDLVFFSAADCTGHGVPGAMLSLLCSTSLTKVVKDMEVYEPAKILDETVKILESCFSKSEKDVSDGMDLALCCLNLKTLELQYAGAFNPLYIASGGELNVIKADRRPVGMFEGKTSFTNHQLTVKKGDCIYVLSDGYTDQFGEQEGKKFGSKKLRELLLQISEKEMEVQNKVIRRQFVDWKGEMEQLDDVCFIGLKV